MKSVFDNLFLLGKPASGKSELLDFMKDISPDERLSRFHIGRYDVLDDFKWLWEKFLEDDVWEKIGKKRLYSERAEHAYVLSDGSLFDFLIEKLNNTVIKKYLSRDNFYGEGTLFIEFSRGGEKPYLKAFSRFDEAVLKKSAIFYIEVSAEEAWRRNEARYQEKLKSSVLAHKVPSQDMKRFYAEDDWAEISEGKRAGYINVSGVNVPFVTMNNEPESKDPVILAPRYKKAFDSLWELYSRAL